MKQMRAHEVKQYGQEIDAYVAVVRDNVKLSDFLQRAGRNCVCLERFVNMETVYFVGDVYPDKMAALKIRRRNKFRVEVRKSNVLLLSIKGKAHLSLEEALEIVHGSPLKNYLHAIEVVAVVPQGHIRGKASKPSAHAYIKFVNPEVAKQCVNIVDALPYNGCFVHSPQLDAHAFMMNESEYAERRSFVWVNPDVQEAGQSSVAASSGCLDSPHSSAGTPALEDLTRHTSDYDIMYDDSFGYSPDMIQALY